MTRRCSRRGGRSGGSGRGFGPQSRNARETTEGRVRLPIRDKNNFGIVTPPPP